jgi:hypothetical protein
MQLGQRLGEGIDPRMFVQDYSGFTRAAEIQAQGMQNLGAMIGQGIKDFGEARQERKKIDAEIKATSAGIESAIKMGKDLGIDIGSYLSPIQAKINDPNTSPAEALALGRTAAQGISNAFTLGIGAQDRAIQQERQRSENAFKLANLEVAQQRANIYGQKAQAEASELTRDTIKAFDPDTGQDKEWDVWKNKQGDLLTPDKKSRIVDPDKYIYGEPGGVQELPPTSQVGGISDSIAKASQLNINQPPSNGVFGFTTKTRDELGRSSIGSRQVSLDFNAAASKDAKGIEIIIPNDATPEERNAANRYVQLTQKFFADRGLNRPIRGVRTAKENGRGTPGRFHTEPFFVGDGEARKIMESDPDGYAQVLANAFNGVQGVTFIAPHKKNDPGASDGKFNERDFAKGSIIPALERLSQGDLSQQAMGTPEQQAQIASQIERNQSLATAQVGQPNQISTDPSLNQQPQPAPRRMVGGRPVGGGQQQKTVKVVSGEEAQRFGLKPEGTYELSFNPTGGLAGVQTVSQPPTETEKAKAEERKVAKEKASASKNIAINTISEFIDDKGVATDALKSAVGYGEAFATGVAEYAPFLGTQSGKTRSDQQRLNRLIEGSILEAASLLKPVSNTDLLMLIKNRPKTTDPEETWTTYLGEIRSILADPNNYLDSGATPTGPSSQAEDDASFIQGFQSGE